MRREIASDSASRPSSIASSPRVESTLACCTGSSSSSPTTNAASAAVRASSLLPIINRQTARTCSARPRDRWPSSPRRRSAAARARSAAASPSSNRPATNQRLARASRHATAASGDTRSGTVGSAVSSAMPSCVRPARPSTSPSRAVARPLRSSVSPGPDSTSRNTRSASG